MGYKAVINDPSYLCHFNPFHSRKNGQFTFKTDPNKIAVAKREVDSILTSKQESVNKLIAKGDKLIDIANALGNEYKKAFSNAKLTDAAKKQILDGLEEDFGKIDDPKKSRFQQIKDNCDGGTYFYWTLEEHIDKALFDSFKNNEKLSKLLSEFEDLKETYWKEAHEIVGDMEEKYKNVDFGFVNNYIYGEKLETSIPSYITRHFDDYWVNDTDEHYSAVERWTKELESDSASHSLDISEDSLTHYNKNHSKTNGQFTSGDGDGDGIVDDHHNQNSRKKMPTKIRNQILGGLERDFSGEENRYEHPEKINLKKLTKNTDDEELFFLDIWDNVEHAVLSNYKNMDTKEAQKLIEEWRDMLYEEAYS